MMQVKFDGKINVATMTGTADKLAVVDVNGRRFALLQNSATGKALAWSGNTEENPVDCQIVTEFSLSPMDAFLQDCNAVRAKYTPAITGLRQRMKDTGLTLSRIRLVAEAADVQIVADGKDLKVVPLF